MKTEAEIEAMRQEGIVAQAAANRLLELLNPPGGDISVELTILGPNGPEVFNVGVVHAALEAHCGRNQHSTDAEHHMFSKIENQLPGHKAIRKHYRFNAVERTCHLTYTWAKLDEHYDVTDDTHQVNYHSDKVPDNFTWKMIINGICTAMGSRNYVNLYWHDFEFIVTRKGGEIHYQVIPKLLEQAA